MRGRSQEHPLLTWDESASPFRKGRPVQRSEPVRLRLGEPVPPKPRMVDHHILPAPVVSSRLKDCMEPPELQGVQWLAADVRVGDSVLRYWLLHMWRRLACVDRERSVIECSDSGLTVLGIDKLVLNERVLREVPLQERLAFRLEEAVVHVFHRSVVERVMSLTPPPEGLRFIPVPEWNDSAGFR
ncbi:imm11 family protein [Pyxidicoccus parkwayensis]